MHDLLWWRSSSFKPYTLGLPGSALESHPLPREKNNMDMEPDKWQVIKIAEHDEEWMMMKLNIGM